MSRGRKRLREVKDATKALQPAKQSADLSLRVGWRLPDGTFQSVHQSGLARSAAIADKPAVQIELDGRTPVTPPAWFSDDGPLSQARDSDPNERRRQARDEPIPPGWEICLDDPTRLHVMLKRIPPDPDRPRGQRPRAIEPPVCAGRDPHCQGCRDVDAVIFFGREARAHPKPPAIGMNFDPFLYGRAW